MKLSNTNKLIILCFPRGAGGHFVINALGLSNNAIFMNADLVKLQLYHQFLPKDKLELLLRRLTETTSGWKDLELDEYKLFHNVHQTFPPTIPLDFNNIDPIIAELIEINQHYFFSSSHDVNFVNYVLEFSKDAKVIRFENSSDFINWRDVYGAVSSLNYWTSVRGKDWPLTPPDIISADTLPKYIYDELMNKFNGDILFIKLIEHIHHHKEIVGSIESDDILIWNTAWFFSKEQTLLGIKNLYIALELDDFDPDAIGTYYTAWFNKLEQLRHK